MCHLSHIFLALVAVFLIKIIVRRIQKARFAKKHGCQSAVLMEQSERLIGLEFFRAQLKANAEHMSLQAARERYEKYGPTLSLTMMGMEIINTIDEENIKALLSTQFKDFSAGARICWFGDLLGAGIFTTDGAQWEHSRSLIRPNFKKAQVADLSILEKHFQVLFAQIPKDGSTVDIQALFFKLTLDTATDFLFGESVGSLNGREGSRQDQFGKAFDIAQYQLNRRARLGKLVQLLPDRGFKEACSTVHGFVDEIVRRALEKASPHDAEKSIDADGQPERYTFLSELVKSTQDPKQLRDELLNILLAGRDTTASLLGNVLHILAKRPDIWQKLRAEVDKLDGAIPKYETLKNMQYLKCLLNESLRLYPVVPANARFAVRDTTLPRGGGPDGLSPIFIPRGGMIAYHVYNLHRQTSIYGPDALEFRPERWLPSENLRPGWSYLPFNGGPRICVGQNFALTEAGYTIVRMAQMFKSVEDRDVGQPWVENLTLTCSKFGGVKVGLVPRKS